MARAVLRIGTRASPLARAQAKETAERVRAFHEGRPSMPERIEIVVLETRGDQVQDRPLSEIGGKGLFTKEIDAALLEGRIDVGAHSMKDVQTTPPEGLSFVALLPREDVRDAFLSENSAHVTALPPGATVGTASLRRQAQLLWRRPDLKVTMFRGNVQTRLRKLREGVADATFLALAGLNRLGLSGLAQAVIETDEMLPAVAQGAIGLSIREDDADAAALFEPLNHAATSVCVAAERAFLRRLDGSCRTPIAGLAELSAEGMRFRGEILKPDGAQRFAAERVGPTSDAERMGLDAAEEVLAAAGPGFFDGITG